MLIGPGGAEFPLDGIENHGVRSEANAEETNLVSSAFLPIALPLFKAAVSRMPHVPVEFHLLG
jgi:hypothetical protein